MNKIFLLISLFIFINAQDYRIESDSLGPVKVPKEKYYGAQTARALENFKIGVEKFPPVFIRALGVIKKAAAIAHERHGDFNSALSRVIQQASEEVISGKLADHFPLVIWQAAGTQTNMNVNEVISNRAIELLGGELGSKKPVHPNDHVNKGQSTNDVIPAAANIAAVELVVHELLPALHHLKKAFQEKADEFKDIVKLGRTHL